MTVVVCDDGGRPLPGVEVHAKTIYGYGFWVREEREGLPRLDLATDAEGRVAFDVLPCVGEVKALRQGRVNSARFTAEAGSSPVVEIRLPDVTGTIRGRVLERGNGVPVAGRPVKAWWENKVIAEGCTDDQGRFTLSGVPAGRVWLWVEGRTDANDPMGRRIDPKSPYGYAEQRFQMGAGEDRSVEFALPRLKGERAERATTVVDVTCVDADGAPVADARVHVNGRIGDTECRLGDVKTDARGHARLEVVAAERYEIVASDSDDGRSANLEREPAASIDVRLTLAADPK